MATEMSGQAAPLPATTTGMLAPATVPAFSSNNPDAYTWFQSVSTRQFVDILSNYLSRYWRTSLFRGRHVSSCLPAYSFVLTPFEALASLPSPQSDDFINRYLGFPKAKAGPSSIVSTSSSTKASTAHPSSIIGPATRPLISTQHRRGCGPQSTYLRAPSLLYGGQQRGWANTTSFRPPCQRLGRLFVRTLTPPKT